MKFPKHFSLPFRLTVILSVAVSLQVITRGQGSSAPGKLQLSKAMYEDQCGNPLYESMAWSMVTGKVVEVVDGSTITIVLDNKTRRRIHLAAVAAPDIKEEFGKAARKMLKNLVLGKQVRVLVNPSNDKAEELTGDIFGVNQKLIEMGMVRYKQPAPYTISNYMACVYQIIEAEAQNAKRGLWQKTDSPKPTQQVP
jgi:endonuclease YncB( thermonuclease family)